MLLVNDDDDDDNDDDDDADDEEEAEDEEAEDDDSEFTVFIADAVTSATEPTRKSAKARAEGGGACMDAIASGRWCARRKSESASHAPDSRHCECSREFTAVKAKRKKN
jgi:hypothetical protein